jgi:hypothetical protein
MRADGTKQTSDPLRVKRGVLQGDTLSPLLFCLALSSLSHALETLPKYQTSTLAVGRSKQGALAINHIFYVDDGKLFSPSLEGLNASIELLESEASAIGLNLNPRKCGIASTEQTKPDEGTKGILDIPIIGESSPYKYLGIEEVFRVADKAAWKRVKSTMMQRLNKLLDSDLSAGQIIKGYNTAVLPVGRYLFANTIAGRGKLQTVEHQARNFDKLTKKQLVKHKMAFATSSLHRMFIGAARGGLGFRSAIDTLYEGIIYTWCYMQCTPSLAHTRALFRSMNLSTKRSIESDMRAILKRMPELTIEAPTDPTDFVADKVGVVINGTTYKNPRLAARKLTSLLREALEDERLDAWRKRKMSSRIIQSDNVNTFYTSLWVKKGAVNKVSWRNALAAQEGNLYTNHLSGANGGRCRHCNGARETVQHVVSACPRFRTSLMMDRHNRIARAIYDVLCRKYGFTQPHYTQSVPSVQENDDAIIYWDQFITTRHKLKHYRPDIVVFDKREHFISIIEVSCTWFTRLDKQHEVKFQKYGANSMMSWAELMEVPLGENPQPDQNLMKELGELWGKEYTALGWVSTWRPGPFFITQFYFFGEG